jgi:hypothetical protein
MREDFTLPVRRVDEMPKPGHPVERSPTVSDEREKIQIEEPERVADRVAEEEDEDFEAHRLQVERVDNDGKVDVGRVDAGRVDGDGTVDVGRVDAG